MTTSAWLAIEDAAGVVMDPRVEVLLCRLSIVLLVEGRDAAGVQMFMKNLAVVLIYQMLGGSIYEVEIHEDLASGPYWRAAGVHKTSIWRDEWHDEGCCARPWPRSSCPSAAAWRGFLQYYVG